MGFPDGQQFMPGAVEQGSVRNRRRGKTGFPEGVGRGDGKTAVGREHMDLAQLTRKLQVPAIGHREAVNLSTPSPKRSLKRIAPLLASKQVIMPLSAHP
jgi:hypothetical protein